MVVVAKHVQFFLGVMGIEVVVVVNGLSGDRCILMKMRDF